MPTQRRGAAPSYESRADATEGHHFIRTWSPIAFWMGVVVVVCGMLGFVSWSIGASRDPVEIRDYNADRLAVDTSWLSD